jgi:anthranilate synthase/aminodeoxychorismate synthase-like glutamine amidotransferase
MNPARTVLAIDNYDSFVHLLAEEFRRRGCRVDVRRSHWPLEDALAHIASQRPDLLLLSPGPGGPAEAELCLGLLREAPEDLPIFGVCLGLQCIVHHFGGRVERAARIVHGKPALVTHRGEGLFRGLETPMQVGRYHSLVGRDLPEELVVDAECDGETMAVRHRHRPIHGVQFHPESILTPEGGALLDHLLADLEVHHAL